MARGKILAFLDAHTEVNVGWIEPHLDILQSNHQLVLQPFIDSIDSDTMQYTNARRVFKGAFTWDLRYVWLRTPEYLENFVFSSAQAFETPVLVGCAIIVRKDYFFKIGSFDSGMSIWGGENIDLSFRTWLCGGGAMIVPCSRIGHLFRNVPYKDSQFQVRWQTNLHRVADVWLDRFAKFYYASVSFYNYTIEKDSYYKETIRKRFDLRNKLNCRPFDWFLKYVFPQLPIPDSHVLHIGEIKSQKSTMCWSVFDKYVRLRECFYYQIDPNNQFILKSNGLLMHGDRCVIMNLKQPFLLLDSCPAGSPDEKYGIWHMEIKSYSWGYLKLRLKIGHWPVIERCAIQVTSAGQFMKGAQIPQVQKCLTVAEEIWSFTNRFVY
ncbi:DgyrCDS11300 [Dimorphilus gyrociliatus]|uniref:DgyrCDS11300 n=1 Tax=Dimorphilus gyrociliatus TaxID=2664684 RepID=A0A7I8W3X8_9ANNE|nr:DgyrCDS11300 [Dimorphilus gyrociliatus]